MYRGAVMRDSVNVVDTTAKKAFRRLNSTIYLFRKLSVPFSTVWVVLFHDFESVAAS
jgi:hypothetical protein